MKGYLNVRGAVAKMAILSVVTLFTDTVHAWPGEIVQKNGRANCHAPAAK